LRNKNKVKVMSLKEKGFKPFPDPISKDPTKLSSAFKFEDSGNIYIYTKECKVENVFTFSLGGDASLIIEDYFQKGKFKRNRFVQL